MEKWRECIINEQSSIMDAVQAIDRSGMQVALVTDDDLKLKGVLNDGDIRRAVINGVDFRSNITSIMKTDPTVARLNQSKETIQELMKLKKVHQIPVLDDNDCVCDVLLFSDVIDFSKHDNPVVLMAGGLGERLMPLTADAPKPLLKVGTKPILEIILESFIEKGFRNFYLSVNYKSEMIEKYFGDGSERNVTIQYLKEKKRLGTAGALSMLPEESKLPVIVMNGDILTKVDYESLMAHHTSEGAEATMAVREYANRIPYGVIDVEGGQISSIREKPMEKYLVNAGIYVINPDVVGKIKKDTYFDMTDLFGSLIEAGKKTVTYPIHEYWLDIGRMDDFERAQTDYEKYWG